MSLKYEPSSEPLHISAKQLFLHRQPSEGVPLAFVGSLHLYQSEPEPDSLRCQAREPGKSFWSGFQNWGYSSPVSLFWITDLVGWDSLDFKADRFASLTQLVDWSIESQPSDTILEICVVLHGGVRFAPSTLNTGWRFMVNPVP